jgi:hypothetical protein
MVVEVVPMRMSKIAHCLKGNGAQLLEPSGVQNITDCHCEVGVDFDHEK